MPRRLPHVLGLAVALVGVSVLARALSDATPVAFFGTDTERESIAAGRDLLPWAALALAGAAGALYLAGKARLAVVVLLPGIVCPALALGLPETLYAWIAFLALAPAAVFAALGAALGPPEPPGGA